MLEKTNKSLKTLSFTLLLIVLGLNWGGVQLGVWTVSSLDNLSEMTFEEAFKHSLVESGQSQDDQDCVCVPCQLTESESQEGFNGVPTFFSSLTEATLVMAQDDFFFKSVNNGLIIDSYSDLSRKNSPPQSPPPQPFV